MGIKVLLVDDDPNILDTAADVLEEAGFEMFKASSGSVAKSIAGSSHPDIAVLDFNLPDTTGNVLAAELLALCPKLKTILMSGQAELDPGASKAAFHAILTKPVDPPQLVNTIRKLVEN